MVKFTIEGILLLVLVGTGVLISVAILFAHFAVLLLILAVGYGIYRHKNPKRKHIVQCPECELQQIVRTTCSKHQQ